MTESFRQLKVLEPELYQNLVTLGHLQSGITDTRGSYNKYIPTEDHKIALEAAMKGYENGDPKLDAFIETNQFYKNNWNDNDIVPVVRFAPYDAIKGGVKNKVILVPSRMHC